MSGLRDKSVRDNLAQTNASRHEWAELLPLKKNYSLTKAAVPEPAQKHSL